MKRFLLSLVLLTVMVAVAGCKTKTREWNDRDRRAVREEVRAYRDMVYLNNLAELEFEEFADDVVGYIEVDYPVYTTFVELPSKGDTVEVYVVSTIVKKLNADAHNMRNIFPYPWLVSEGILPANLDHQAQRAFYECFARKVRNNYPSTTAFFNAVVNDSSTSQLTALQEQCAADLFDWNIVIEEEVVATN